MAFFDDSSSFFSSSFGGDFGGHAGDALMPRRSSGGFSSQPFEEFASPSLLPSQQTKQSRASPSFQGTAASGAEGLVYVTVGMLHRAAREMREGGEETKSEKKAFRLHGNDVGLVGLRGWVAPPGCEKLASLVRFKLEDGTGQVEVEYDVVDGKPWWGVFEEEAAGVVVPELDANGTREAGKDGDEGETGSRNQTAEAVQVLSGKKRFLEVGSLVRIAAGVSTDLKGEVSLSASACSPIKDPAEFVLLHPAAVAHAAATFAARRGTLQAQEEKEVKPEGDQAVKKIKTEDAKAETKHEGDGETEATAHLSPEEAQKLLADYGHIEDLVQREIILILLTQGGGAKRAPRATVKAEALRRNRACTEEQLEAALKELEEAAEIIEHAGFVALAC
ncbi:conserved hypothetical protein [Neospora caninum Liverpool]|uniref:Uncharacterized protein n=1 Tax=Neospora caninum (strain Liverpool) TaxID=572307 RepID=F0VBI2_NEOCL|nr:conserved hypothetical protein [Neospora caninum Liverpool]CBZ50966.1 conserved hypothetical protein [Neospora caninum Liverpool]CEL68268.1 TPA: hypothetical protein BN1204_040410 [Neospora caninum Liverpool]|eukprot:XP_003880999.1 conserved hypothetical protein [Neospora caninum Liverpool]